MRKGKPRSAVDVSREKTHILDPHSKLSSARCSMFARNLFYGLRIVDTFAA